MGPAALSDSAEVSGRTNTLALSAITLVAFGLRVAVSYRAVLGQEYVAFIENDAWYHMRLVDGLISRFPWRIWHDAYLLHPGGEPVNVFPLLDWLIAGTALLLGAGNPSPRVVDLAGAFAPPVIGALTIVPVYMLGRDLFSPRAGLWAAFCAAVMPGSLLLRSALGFTDHHCLEVLLTTLSLALAVRAIDPATPGRSSRVLAMGFGASLAAYLMTWSGGALFVATVSAWAVLEIVRAQARRVAPTQVVRLIVWGFGVAGLLIAPWLGTRPAFGYHLLALGGGIAVSVGLYVLSRVTARLQYGPAVFFGVIAVALSAGAGGVLQFSPDWFGGLMADLGRLSPWRDTGFVSEAAPLMKSRDWQGLPLWNEFTSSLPLALVGLAAGVVTWARVSSPVRLLLVWTTVSLAATFGQVRFAYYLSVSIAILAGLGCDTLFSWLFRRRHASNGGAGAWATQRRSPARAIVAAGLVLAIVGPGTPGLIERAGMPPPLTSDWFDALQWMRSSTPEPFDDPAAYLDGDARGASGYGVVAWWDYGYWITRVARRVPVTNPRQSAVPDTARFFVESSPSRAAQMLQEIGARYVIADARLQISSSRSFTDAGFFGGIAAAAGMPPEGFCGVFRPKEPADAAPALYCYPDYYRSMAVRLYAFGGKAVTPALVWVIDVEPPTSDSIPRIRNEWAFSTYEEAQQFAALRPVGQLRVVSKDMLASCVPLEASVDFLPVYRSAHTQGPGGPPVVQVFEYRP